MTQIYTSDNSSNGFDATTLSSLPTGWTAISGTWVVKNTAANLISAHTHDFEDTSQGASSIDDTALYTGNGTAADMDVTYAQVIPVGGYTAGVGVTSLGCYVRSDIGNNNGYLFIFGFTAGFNCLLFAKNSGTLNPIGAPVSLPFTPSAGTIVLTRMVCVGNFIGAKVWRSTDPEPTSYTISATDSSVTAAGYAGVRATQQIPSVQANCSDFNVDSIASSSSNFTTLAPTTISVSGGNITISGAYAGTAPGGSTSASVDGGSYSALGSFTASAGTFTGTLTAPANGVHSINVKDSGATTHTDTGIYIVTGGGGGGSATDFSLSPSSMSAFNSVASGNFTVTPNGTPSSSTSISLSDGSAGGTFTPSSLTFTTSSPQTFTYTPSSSRSSAVTISASATGGFTAGPHTATVNVFQAIAPNNSALVYSPYNWNVSSAHAITVQPGAYFKTMFTGNSCVLNFSVANMQSPASQIWARIDDSEWVSSAIAATVTVNVPTVMQSNGDVPYHVLEVIYKGQDPASGANAWDPTTTGTAVNFTGLTLGGGASVHQPSARSKNILIYGDSITEGVRCAGESASPTPSQNDAQMSWAYQLGNLLGAEVGIVGCGGTGFTATFRGVPAFSTSYNLIYSGQSRTFSPVPDLTVVNHGVNDGGASSGTITTAATTAFNGLLGAFATKPIVALAPLPPTYTGSSTVRSAIQTAISNIGNARLTWVDTPGVFNTTYGADSLSIHPSGPNDQALIAPAVAALLSPYIGGGSAPGGVIIGG